MSNNTFYEAEILMRDEEMTPTPPVTLSERAASATLTSGGLTFPLWIDYFDHWLKFFITVIYLTIAIYTLHKQVIKPILAQHRRKRRKQHDRT